MLYLYHSLLHTRLSPPHSHYLEDELVSGSSSCYHLCCRGWAQLLEGEEAEDGSEPMEVLGELMAVVEGAGFAVFLALTQETTQAMRC